MQTKIRNRSLLGWLPLIAYAVFFVWYTNLSGPVSNAEIKDFLKALRTAGAGTEEIERWERFLRSDDGGEFIMVNLQESRKRALLVGELRDDASPQEASARYAAFMLPTLAKHASFPVFMASVRPGFAEAMEVMGSEAELRTWHRAALVRYRSRRDLIAVVRALVADGSYRYKVAALSKSIAVPMRPGLNPGDLRILLGLLSVILSLLIHKRARRDA